MQSLIIFKESLPFGLRRRPHRDLTVTSLYHTKVVPTVSPTMATMPYSGLAVRRSIALIHFNKNWNCARVFGHDSNAGNVWDIFILYICYVKEHCSHSVPALPGSIQHINYLSELRAMDSADKTVSLSLWRQQQMN